MNQSLAIWKSLSLVQRVSLVVVPLLLVAASLGYKNWKHESGFRILYSGMAPEDASAATQKLREAGVEFRLDETGSAISVDSSHLAESRLALAAAGLPRTGRIGFELFDRTNLGESDFAEQINYRRALEGELERTVATLSQVEQARIHITFPKDSVFLESREPAKATVVLRLRRAGRLPEGSVAAIANLLASAVEGLLPEAVAIIDADGRLLNRPRREGDADAVMAATDLDYRKEIERDLIAKINLALVPLLGEDRFRAGINVDCDFSRSEQSDEFVDSSRTAILASQTAEAGTGYTAGSGVPGSASNLPGKAPASGLAISGPVRRTENVSYQPSRTVRKTVSPRGQIRRISTAILVDQAVQWDGAGPKAKKTLVPPSPEKLKVIHDIVAGITGFAEDRGDQITVETLPFENTVDAPPPPAAPVAAKPAGSANLLSGNPLFRNPLAIGGAAGGVVLVLAGIGFFIFKRRKKRLAQVQAQAALAAGQSPEAVSALYGAPAEPSAVDAAESEGMAAIESDLAQIEAEALQRIKVPGRTRKAEVYARHIKESIGKDPTNVAQAIRGWIAEG